MPGTGTSTKASTVRNPDHSYVLGSAAVPPHKKNKFQQRQLEPSDDATKAGAEMFLDATRLNRLKARAEIEASREQARYWRQLRLDHEADRVAKGLPVADVSVSITKEDKLLSGELALDVSRDVCERYTFLYFNFGPFFCVI